MPRFSKEIPQAALSGLEFQRQKVDHQISRIRNLLSSGRGPAAFPYPPVVKPATVKKRTLSLSARKRISAAQKKRWASGSSGLGNAVMDGRDDQLSPCKFANSFAA